MTIPVEQRLLKILAAFEAAGKIVRGVEIDGGKIKLDLAGEAADKPKNPDFVDWKRRR